MLLRPFTAYNADYALNSQADPHKLKMKVFHLLSGLLIVASSKAAIITLTDFETGPGGTGSTFTPSYSVSNTDLINGLTPSFFSGNFAAVELAGGLPVLNDGVYGTITEPGGAPDRTHGAFALAGGGSGTGTSVIYTLGANSLGYNISSIFAYGGWNDGGRDQQLYTVSYSRTGDPSFITLATVNYNPVVGPNVQTANRSILLETSQPYLALGVDQVRFDFPAGVENDYTGYAELDVMGVAAVPEPGSMVMLAFGGLLTLGARRRR